MKRLTIIAAFAAFLVGQGLAGPDSKQSAVVKELMRRQEMLFGDLKKIADAVRDIKEIREARDAGKYVLNDEEIKLEKSARMDFHIFMERARNDTLEVLAIYESVLGKQTYVEPLRKIFGKALDQVVAVDWEEADLDEVVDDLIAGYGVKMFVRGTVDLRKTMSLQGEMTLLSILLQIENVFDAKLIEDDGELWFVPASGAGDE